MLVKIILGLVILFNIVEIVDHYLAKRRRALQPEQDDTEDT